MENKVYVMHYSYAMADDNDNCVSGLSIKVFSTHAGAYLAFMNLIRSELENWSEIVTNVSLTNNGVKADIPDNYVMTSAFEPKSGVFALYDKDNYEKSHIDIGFQAQPVL